MNDQNNWDSLVQQEPRSTDINENMDEEVENEFNFFSLPLERQLTVAELVTPTYYVCGSYIEGEYLWAYSEVKNRNGIEKVRCGTGDNPKYLPSKQISGEAVAILKAIDDAIKHDYHSITIFYSNVCFEHWSDLDGPFPKSAIGQSYRYWLKKKLPEIRVYFKKSETIEQKKLSKELLVRAKQLEYGN